MSASSCPTATGANRARRPRHRAVANSADFVVGKGPSGKLFVGEMDYLRVCRGTLKDAGTSIEELHEWEFNSLKT